MTDHLLEIKNLKTFLDSSAGVVRAVDGINLTIDKGETFALLGESGCGKSMTALSIMGLVPTPMGRIAGGEILLQGEDLTRLSEVQMRKVRGQRIAMIFQEPMTSLNPVLTIGEQIGETLRCHKLISGGRKGAAEKERVLELLDAVGIPDPKQRYGEYPHQLSGGMKQRVMIAIALAGEPDLLIADEPTTALDVTIQAQVLALLGQLQKKTGMAIMLITHDLGVVSQVADRVAVMYAGQIVEQADQSQFFSDPQHPYSKKLFRSVPTMGKRSQPLEVIPGTVPSLTQKFTGCRFAPRCDYVQSVCKSQLPGWTALGERRGVRCLLANTLQFENRGFENQSNGSIEQVNATATKKGLESTELLQVSDLKVHFPIHKGLFQRVAGYVYAVDGVDFNLYTGRTVALVGESGCGKTTAGKGILQLLKQVTSGTVRFDGERLDQLSGEALRKKRGEFQIIFQDPYASMNPRMTVGNIVEEGMLAQGVGSSAQERQQKVDELLEQVGLEAEMKQRYPHEFSGGQRQRICIARALAVNPRLIVCDEPTSALDVSVQAQILNLLKSLQDKMGLSYLFITHDISVVAYLAHEVAVMYLGRIVEQGPVEEVLNNPKHPYTRALLSAVPVIDKDKQTEVIRVEGDIPSPINPPKGCHFHPRCPEAMPVCCERYPEAFTHSPEGKKDDIHRTRCFLYQ